MTEGGVPLTPKVSVVSITYNHEPYIREALDGFVAQNTDFPVEVIVADDASTDGTPAIIREYAAKYPNLIRPILRAKNIGIHANAIDALSAARGEYVALCEGDDYWTDPTKLSRQVEYLDRHPETTVCFHPVRLIWTDDGHRKTSLAESLLQKAEQVFLRKLPRSSWTGDLSLKALISRNFVQTNSVVYRRLSSYDDIPDVMPLDWYLHVRHAARGGIAMLPETMSVYRRHPQGIWYGSTAAPAKFWSRYGPGHVAVLDAMVELFPGDRECEEIIARNADWVLSTITKKVPMQEVRALLEETIAQYPRIATLALRHRRTHTHSEPIKTLWRKVVAPKPSWDEIAASVLPDLNW